ncbi:MAG TPA: type II secretion system protein [Kiritimatiellia bacterium]|nr:type II secretion system protein [Kiritimatiellia bacterium]
MRRCSGFTLFELLAVITIIGIVLAISLGSYTGWGDAHAVRGSAEVIEAALSQAQDYAATHHAPVSFEYQTAITNTLKKTATFQLLKEARLEVATNWNNTVTAEGFPQLIGTVQKLPGNVWLVRRIPVQNNIDDGIGRLVFSPSGKVYSSSGTPVMYAVSRKTRNDNKPNIIYQIEVSPANGAVAVTKRDPEDF